MILFLFLKQERAGYDQREKFCCRNCTSDTVETEKYREDQQCECLDHQST